MQIYTKITNNGNILNIFNKFVWDLLIIYFIHEEYFIMGSKRTTHFKEPPYECFKNVNELIETIKGM